ncbi:ABC transporter ATP-binding protein [Frankia sp. CNm7]|uniref:ABC transporter ATP-binding protein n=1 Tax=Frankia nepalensis TaxID=1836974 RepID=UPI001DA225C5|nr:ABC transporter ATP-binding protein [Frankia nepalensis]MBL7498945.1 ABC transporter ATP-binding protein [Frankia nepalensis]MBL7511258.1 ABC transporter ATP-binding protein [Frankia nepalensis]MBL7520568.1 ABC transporter ATP-binding protein [Frankia nepalensis]
MEDLRIRFSDGRTTTEIVRGVSLTLVPGRCVALVGESGSGKSVTARAIVGLLPRSGAYAARRLTLGDTDLTALGERGWRRVRGRRVGFVHQDALLSLDPLRTAGQEIAEVLRTHRAAVAAAGSAVGAGSTRQRTLQLLRDVGIGDAERRIGQRAHQLSGGQRQRVLIASAIAAAPDLLIADEPTTALDVTVQAQVLELLGARKRRGDALLLISHDLAVVGQLADEILVMRAGEVVERGAAAEVLTRPAHEYTRQLLQAVPTAATRGHSLVTGAPLPARPPGDEVVLEAHGLTKRFRLPRARRAGGASRELVALDRVDLTLRRGETLGVVGESGSGKTTLARVVLGLVQPDDGEVRLLGRPWSALGERSRRPSRQHLRFVSQDPLGSFDPRYPVRKVIGEGLDSVGIHGTARERRLRELLDQVHLPASYLDRHPRTLSGGQRQRVAIARALAPTPAVVVADEAVSALDVSVQAQILDLFAEIQREHGTSLLFISHDLGVVRHLAHRVLVLKDGAVVETGPTGPVLTRPRHAYTQQLVAAVPRLPGSAELRGRARPWDEDVPESADMTTR